MRGRRAVSWALAAAVVAGCGPAARQAATGGTPAPREWPPAGVGRADPERVVAADPVEFVVEDASGAGSLPVWLVAWEDEPSSTMTGLAMRPLEPGPGGAEWTIALYEQSIDADAAGPADPLWESLEPVEAVAAVDLEGDGTMDVATLHLAGECPDPVDPSGVGGPCLLLGLWRGAEGIPETYRLELEGGAASATGREALDRLAGLLAAAPCPALDLRRWTVGRVPGLLRAGEDGELIEGIACVPVPAAGAAPSIPLVAMAERPGPERLPEVTFVPRSGPAAQAAGTGGTDVWADGYELLDDLGGDGVRDWLWVRRTADGREMVVTSGPGRGLAAGSFRTDDDGDLIHRMVVVPPGGRARLLSWSFEPRTASEPARALLEVRIEPAGGGPSDTVELAVPLEPR